MICKCDYLPETIAHPYYYLEMLIKYFIYASITRNRSPAVCQFNSLTYNNDKIVRIQSKLNNDNSGSWEVNEVTGLVVFSQ